MKRELSYQKSMGLKGGPNHVEISITGYRADSPDRFRDHNLIPTNNISMVGVPHPVLGIDDLGNQQIMMPGLNYQFGGSQVLEFPIRAYGGPTEPPTSSEPTTPPIPGKKAFTLFPGMYGDVDWSTRQSNAAGFPVNNRNWIDAFKLANKVNKRIRKDMIVEEGVDPQGNPIMVDYGQYRKVPVSQFVVKNAPDRVSFQIGGPVDFKTMLRDIARQQVKGFGNKSEAPQNMTTENMIDYKNNMFTNKIAQNNFKAMAMQEADEMANMMNQMMIPMAQFGMNLQSYDADLSNAGAYFDAYNTMKNRSQEDFNNFLGESGEMIQSIYSNPAEMKLKKVRTRITDPTVKDQYDQYSKDMKTGMTPTEPTDPWEAFNQNIKTMKEKKKPISMNDIGPIPMGFGYTPQGMVFMVGGSVPEFEPGGGIPYNQPPGYLQTFNLGNLPVGSSMVYNRAGYDPVTGLPFQSMPQLQNFQINKNYPNAGSLGYKNPLLYQRVIPGTNTSDPSGGIGQSMYASGFYDTYDDQGRQIWTQYPRQASLVQYNTQGKASTSSGTTEDVKPTPPAAENVSTTTGDKNNKSTSTEEIKTFTHENVSSQGNTGTNTAGTNTTGTETTRRGNVTDEGSGSSSTTQNQVVNPQGGFFVTQPGYYGQQGVGYNLFPSNMRWQRGPGMNVGPAVAYNPMNTYLKDYDYKGRFFGKGPRRVKMSFSHYGQPGMPGMPSQPESSSAKDIPMVPPGTQPEHIIINNDNRYTSLLEEGFKPSPNAIPVEGIDNSQSVLNSLKYGGMFPAAAPYPGAYPFHAYTAFFQYGGENPVGTPNTGNDPWAQTEAVWKRQMAGNTQDMADWGLAGMSMLSSFAEANERRDLEEQMKQRMFGDAVFNPYGAGDSSRGSWTVNRGDFRPDQHTPVQFQGWNQGMIGSPMTQAQYGGGVASQAKQRQRGSASGSVSQAKDIKMGTAAEKLNTIESNEPVNISREMQSLMNERGLSAEQAEAVLQRVQGMESNVYLAVPQGSSIPSPHYYDPWLDMQPNRSFAVPPGSPSNQMSKSVYHPQWPSGQSQQSFEKRSQGGQYQTGGEYYLSDDEIQQIMAMGGQVEFLD